MKNLAKKLIIVRLNRKVRQLLRNNTITVIGVTGSIGKTSTKLAIGQVLSATRKVRYSEDSYNTDIGIPLSIFGQKVPTQLWNARAWKKIFTAIDNELKHYHYDTVVLELADDELAMMQKVLSIISPDISVVSAVAPVHMERMGTMGQIVHDNWQIAATAKTIVYNADNEDLRKKAYKNGTVGFGMKHGHVRFDKVTRGKKGTLKATLHIGKQSRSIQTNMLGVQNLYSLLAAATVADLLEIPFGAICFELTQIRPPKGRMSLLTGIEGTKIIDDSYNASPDAVVAAINTLSELDGRKVAILGTMNELGDDSVSAHQRVGRSVAKVADLLVTIGRPAEEYLAPAALRAGLKPEQVKVFNTPYEAGHYVKGIVKKGDTILVKGSQDKVYSEEAARILLASDIDPKKVLVRQGVDWKRRKKKSFA